MTQTITVRNAAESDLPTLVAIKGEGSEAIHRDRLVEAQGPDYRYLVLLLDQQVIGFACLVFRRPASWSDSDDTQNLPLLVDLQVSERYQGRGYGTAFIGAIEGIAAEAGYNQHYLQVEPLDNPRAHALYRRLGYQPLQSEPYLKPWRFTDSDGNLHHGEPWVVDMVKRRNT